MSEALRLSAVPHRRQRWCVVGGCAVVTTGRRAPAPADSVEVDGVRVSGDAVDRLRIARLRRPAERV